MKEVREEAALLLEETRDNGLLTFKEPFSI